MFADLTLVCRSAPLAMLRLLAWASTNRALIVAILLVVLCWWLLRPKPLTAPAEQATGAPSGRASTHPATFVPKKRAVSVSTPGVLLHFRAGVPEVDDSALTALLSLCAVTDIYLVTQLETDSDVQVCMSPATHQLNLGEISTCRLVVSVVLEFFFDPTCLVIMCRFDRRRP